MPTNSTRAHDMHRLTCMDQSHVLKLTELTIRMYVNVEVNLGGHNIVI